MEAAAEIRRLRDVIYTIELADLPESVPAQVRATLRDSLAEITAVIAAMPPGSSVFSVFRDERLHLDLMGWRFYYQVDHERWQLKVIEARPAGASPA
jgi:hypothetical protein